MRAAAFILTFAIPLLSPKAKSNTDLPAADSSVVIRDRWGVPHIIAPNERLLFFGAGYAAAEDRLFQMVLCRLSIQGRLAEFFGSSFVERDKRIRTIGYYRHAEQSLGYLSDTTRTALQAYADGVNAYMAQHPEHLAALFQSYAIRPEKWTAADGIACFLRIAERFDGGWTNEIAALRKYEELEQRIGREQALSQLEQDRRRVDDSSAIVSQAEYQRYSAGLLHVSASTSLQKGTSETEPVWTAPTMSHNWCVAGSKSKTGLPILESDPQISVESPSTWYEFHLQGGRFNVRGIGVPGTPAMLIGYNDHLAWGATALGSDNADLFQEQFKAGSTTEYRWKDGWETMTERSELIKVKNASTIAMTVKSTRHGPVVNEFLTGLRSNEVFALHYVVTKDPATEVEGLLEMMAAKNWTPFTKGVAKYRSPGIHVIYADKMNNIGYYTMARLPHRAFEAGIPFRGWTGDEEWKGYIPFGEMPRMLNPLSGFISTANNCPIGSWYPYYVGGAIGDNARSWRLKELLGGDKTFSPDDFLTIHRDAVNPIARDFVFFALLAMKEENPANADAQAAAALLANWDYRMYTSFGAYALVSSIPTNINRTLRGTPLEQRYLGGSAGLVQLFLDLEAHYDSTKQLLRDSDIRSWLITQLGECYRKSGIGSSGGRPVAVTHTMLYQNNLEGFGSLSSAYNIVSPPLKCGVVETIWSQTGNSYSQIVDFSKIDSSSTIIPPGNSEVPSSKHFKDQVDLWVTGTMHVAPLSYAALLSIEESRYTVRPTATLMGESQNAVPQSHRLEDNYPNPFNAATMISYELSERTHVRIAIYNTVGQEITLLVNERQEPGSYQVRWLTDHASGVYYARMTAGEYSATKKLVLMR